MWNCIERRYETESKIVSKAQRKEGVITFQNKL